MCQAKIDYLQSSVVQCRGCPKKAVSVWSSIDDVIGLSKLHKPVINDKISFDCINEFFQNVAVLFGAACFSPPSTYA